MNMNINNINTNKVTVKTSSISKIKIPMIQRDYVQGLDDKKLVPFLNALINTLSHQSKIQQIETLSLDFIYGNINEDGVFEPIDGQQRLTTLALLTFYLYCRQKNSNNKIKNPFTYITYATRQSAKKFCELLSKDEFKDEFENNKPSNVIKKNSKYFREYDEDTTISAMLKTLDKIHEIINDKKPNINNNTGQDDIQSFINTLASNIDKINFHIFPMESFNLSDDLYIKMNGRGKQLSSFDNFKADYFKWLEDASDNIDKLIPDSFGENSIDKLNTLKRKFDTDYIDIFWDHALENSKNTNEAPEPEKLFFRFINRFVISKSDLSKLPDDFINNSENLDYEYSSQLFDIYKKCFEKNHNIFITLLMNLTNIKNINDYFQTSWVYKFDKDNEINFNIFDKFTYKDRFAYNNIMRFFEQENAVKNLDEAKKYSRIIWNITEQFFTLNEISKDNYNTANNGYDVIYIKDWKDINKSFSEIVIQSTTTHMQIIIKDEVIKCKYIIKNNIYYKIFIQLEGLKYIRGTIGFILDENTLELNNSIILKIKQTFSDRNSYSLFIRALLSKIVDINLLQSKVYKSDTIIEQLINEKEFKNNAKKLLEHDKIQEYLQSLANSYSELSISNTDAYSDFTAVCTHEGLYRDNNIDNYKIHNTYGVYWLMHKSYSYASTVHMRSYCSVRYKLINALKILSNTIKENKELDEYTEAIMKYNKKHYTDRNEHVNFTTSHINFTLKFELNNIYIDDYKYKCSMYKFSSINSNTIDKKVIDIYDTLIDCSIDLVDIHNFLCSHKEKFVDIIKNSGIECYVNPFRNMK